MTTLKSISKISLAIVAAASFSAATASAQDQAQPAATPAPPAAVQPPQVIMTVDGTAITQADFQERFMARFARQFQQMSPEQQAQARPQVQQMIMNELVQKTLLLNAADAKGLKATDTDVDKTLKEIAGNLPEGRTLEEFAQSAGLSVDRIRQQVTSDLRIEKLIEDVTKDVVKPTDEEVQAHFKENADQFAQKESVKARHILISTKGITDEAELAEKKAVAEGIRAELVEKKGENFAEVAKAKSEGPSGKNGGDLGQFGRGQMVPAFDKAAFAQEVGAVGDLVKTDFGYHIIQVQEKKEGKNKEFAEVKEEIAEGLMNQRRNGEIQKYLGGLQAKAKIVQAGQKAPAEKPAPGPGAVLPAKSE